MDLTQKIEHSGALIKDAGAADKGDLLKEIAELLNEHAPGIICEYVYGGIDVFCLDYDHEEEAFQYSRITVKSGFENIRYGTTYDKERS